MRKTLAKGAVAVALIAAAPFALAQSTTTSTSTSTTTPGTPNTGMGGDAATTAIVLTLSGLLALGGLGYLARTRTV